MGKTDNGITGTEFTAETQRTLRENKIGGKRDNGKGIYRRDTEDAETGKREKQITGRVFTAETQRTLRRENKITGRVFTAEAQRTLRGEVGRGPSYGCLSLTCYGRGGC